MSEQEWRNNIRAAVESAAAEGLIKMNQLAKKAGWTHPQMDKFRKEGTGKHEKICILERLLRRLGYLTDPVHDMVRDLHLLADILDSPDIDKEIKGKRYSAFVDSYIIGRKRYLALIKKGKSEHR